MATKKKLSGEPAKDGRINSGRKTLGERGASNPLSSEDKKGLVEATLNNMPVPPRADDAPAENMLSKTDVDIWLGLTDRQKAIQTMKLQGVSTKTIATTLGITAMTITNELKAIRRIHAEKGAALNPEEYIGEALALHQVIESEMWLVVAKEKHKGNNAMVMQALQGVLNARNSMSKLLLDIGLVKKAPEKVDHNVNGKVEHEHAHMHTNPLLESMTKEQQASFGHKLIVAQLSDLDAPTPPEPTEYVVEYEEAKKAD